jgi:hypothetical protein
VTHPIFFVTLIVPFFWFLPTVPAASPVVHSPEAMSPPDSSPGSFATAVGRLYEEIGLEAMLPRDVFRLAMIGHYNLKGEGVLATDTIITIIDYTKPSIEERLYVINLKQRKVVLRSLVSHGKNSGHNLTESFSNRPGSLKSSLGFFVTGETYRGVHGYSLRLTGVEPGVNDNARRRAIVLHGAGYVSNGFSRRWGRLGRSWGCPAVPRESSRMIIDAIKNKTCMFAYFDDKKYLGQSPLLDIDQATQHYLKEVNAYDEDADR